MKFIKAKHSHGSFVAAIPPDEESSQYDGVVTQEQNYALLVTHADCQAAIFYDPVTRSIGCIHAGWRGNVQDIYGKAILKMKDLFGTLPSNLFVGISPSLGPCCAEFLNHQQELPSQFLPFQVKSFHFDLWKISRSQLMKAGVPSDQIEIAQLCTRCHPMGFYSHRRDKTKYRHTTMVALLFKSYTEGS